MKVRLKKFTQTLIMILATLFLSIFSYGVDIDVSNWSEFDSAYTRSDDNTIKLLSDITFGATLANPNWTVLNIVGNISVPTPIVLSGNNTYGGFLLDNNKTLNFTGTLSFNMFVRNTGGALYAIYLAEINFNYSTVTFNSNTANSYGRGGVVYSDYGGQINFNSSSISFNSNSTM